MTLRLWSDALVPDHDMPVRFTADGENISPPLRWANVPSHARELALLLEDLDGGERRPVVHWVVWKIPARLDGLPEGIGVPPPEPGTEAAQIREGMNALDHAGYDGPEPPDDRAHRYRFRLVAIDAPLEVSGTPTRDALERAMRGHIVEQAELLTSYTRRE